MIQFYYFASDLSNPLNTLLLIETKLITMKKLILLTLNLLFAATMATAQTAPSEIAMTDGSFTTCVATFTDSGGSTGDYAAGENFITTICSPFATDQVQALFSSWNVTAGAVLLAYDGPTATGSPIGVFNPAIAPTVVVSTPGNTSGCLTFRFISTGTNTGAGWQADLSCVDNCQTISNTVVITPTPDADEILRICQGETVNFSGSTAFSVDGTGATNEWRFSDDPSATITGATASRIYNNPGVYRVDYVTTDATGCRDRDIEDLIIFVSTTPDFTGTVAANTTLCFGESTTIEGLVETVEFVADVAPPVTGQTYLPDDNGTTFYETCIDVEGFPIGATVQNASDIVNVFINMEHSYIGDLDIFLLAPDGSQIDFLIQGGTPFIAGQFLGQAIDNSIGVPGVGEDYFFTDTATTTLRMAADPLPGGTTVPSGSYRPENPFSDLIGTPLNGLWCLRVIDNLSIDDGYIFYWGINFDPAIVPISERFEPGESSEQWLANADITATNGSEITVTPTVAGQNCYDFEFTDSFGCIYTETVCIDVAAEITSIQPTDIIVCQNSGSVSIDLTLKDDEIRNGLSNTDYSVTYFNSDADAQADMNAVPTPDNFGVTGNITVWARVFDTINGCFSTEQVNVVYQEVTYNSVPPIEICDDLAADEVESFDLTSQIATILGMQSAADFEVTFFNSQQDADANMNAILNTDDYENISNPETIFVRISNVQDQDCFQTGNFVIEVLSAPAIGTVTDVSDCASDPVANRINLTLTDYNAAVLNGQNAAAFTVSYHNSEDDAIDNVNILGASYSSSDQETIYARITDNDSGCFDYTSFNVTVEVCEVIIPEGFSPNADGVNDTFSMPNIEQFPNFELTVFNRNGNKVYVTRASNYIEFAGIPNQGGSVVNGLLPVGTYFYVIKYNDPNIEDIASWVYINY